jgi:DNA-binding MarR family transcriptional regulator
LLAGKHYLFINRKRKMTDLDPEAVVALRGAIGRLSRQLRQTTAGAGLTPTQTSVLLTVARRGPLGLAELAGTEGLNATMLSRAVAALTQAGLLTRVADPGDRRAAQVDATAAGRRMREKIHRERNQTLSVHLAELSAEHRRRLHGAIPALEALADQLREGRP